MSLDCHVCHLITSCVPVVSSGRRGACGSGAESRDASRLAHRARTRCRPQGARRQRSRQTAAVREVSDGLSWGIWCSLRDEGEGTFVGFQRTLRVLVRGVALPNMLGCLEDEKCSKYHQNLKKYSALYSVFICDVYRHTAPLQTQSSRSRENDQDFPSDLVHFLTELLTE